jgi:hypothetical protein
MTTNVRSLRVATVALLCCAGCTSTTMEQPAPAQSGQYSQSFQKTIVKTIRADTYYTFLRNMERPRRSGRLFCFSMVQENGAAT